MSQRLVKERKVKAFESKGFKVVENVKGRGGAALFLMEKPEPKIVKAPPVKKKRTQKPQMPKPKTDARGITDFKGKAANKKV